MLNEDDDAAPKRITPQAAKSKGRRFQQKVRDALLETFAEILHPPDIRSTSMGSSGDDLLLSQLALLMLPYNFEMKNVETPSLWQALGQTCVRSSATTVPVTVLSRNKVKLPNAVVALPASHFYQLLHGLPHVYAPGPIPLVKEDGFTNARREFASTGLPSGAVAFADAYGQQWRHFVHTPQTFNLWLLWPEYLLRTTDKEQTTMERAADVVASARAKRKCEEDQAKAAKASQVTDFNAPGPILTTTTAGAAAGKDNKKGKGKSKSKSKEGKSEKDKNTTALAVTIWRDGIGLDEPRILCEFQYFLGLVKQHWLASAVRPQFVPALPTAALTSP